MLAFAVNVRSITSISGVKLQSQNDVAMRKPRRWIQEDGRKSREDSCELDRRCVAILNE